MIEIYSIPSRNYVDQTLTSGPVLLSDWVDVSTCGDILIRWQIEQIDPGEQVIFTYAMYNGAVYQGGRTINFTTVGYHQIGFGRGDFDTTTIVYLTLQVVGRVRMNAKAYSVAKGEAVPIWP
jgi:hypothetical protein